MPLYLTVSEGARADRARPILALSDRQVIAALLREIGRLSDLIYLSHDPPADEPHDPTARHLYALPRTPSEGGEPVRDAAESP